MRTLEGAVIDLGFASDCFDAPSESKPVLVDLDVLHGEVAHDVPIGFCGGFIVFVPLDEGPNTLQLCMVLRWNHGDGANLDLHIFKRTAAEGNVVVPAGANRGEFKSKDRHVYGSNGVPQDPGSGFENPFLYIDNMWGFGPETIMLEQLPDEEAQHYHVWVHNKWMPESVTVVYATLGVFLNNAPGANEEPLRYEVDLAVNEYWHETTLTLPVGK